MAKKHLKTIESNETNRLFSQYLLLHTISPRPLEGIELQPNYRYRTNERQFDFKYRDMKVTLSLIYHRDRQK